MMQNTFIKQIKKIIFLFLIVHCLSLGEIVHCKAQEIEWEYTTGGSLQDNATSIQQTSDGGYIIGGFSLSLISGDKTEDRIGHDDYWIVKTDASGTIQWQNTIGGSSSDKLYSLQQTADGGYILGGWSASDISGDKTENCLGDYDYWIVKTDSLGTVQWENTIGGSDADQLFSIRQTTDGGYVLVGWSLSGNGGDKTENSNGSWDYWMVKTDSLGAIQWQNTIGGAELDRPYSIRQTADGGYILGGFSSSDISGDKTENAFGYDYWMVKTDSSGTIQWDNTIGGSGYDELRSVQQTADGGYILGGWSNSSGNYDKTENCIGGSDYWIVKTDASGTIQWQNTIGGSTNDNLYSISQTADGGYALGGKSFSNISGDKTENSMGGWDYWLVRTDALGTVQWQNTIGGSDQDELRSIQETIDGGFILGGWSESDASGDKAELCMGKEDYWMVKITDKYNFITGKLFIDINSNLVQDTGEPAVSNNQIIEINTGRFTFSQGEGIYYLNVADSGNFSAYTSPINYYTPVPATHSAYFSGIQQIDSLNDFAFQPTVVLNDLCVTITPLGNFRAGFNANYMINYENVGTTTLSPTIIVFPDNDVVFVSANPVASSVTTDSVVWNFGPLAPFQTGCILVTVNVNLGTPIGTLINSSVEIDPVIGDANTACNYHAWEVFVTGSFDPNAILVDRDTVFTTELSNPPYLDYIIYFQNTGNDTAFNVKILNPIDTLKLDLSTIEFVASSHPVNVNFIYHERNMEFKFDNILLPDSNINEPASHGFARYRIKPKTSLSVGDNITNFAAIYFDYNYPVLTNTAITKIVLPTGISESSVASDQWSVYPNPADQTITVASSLMTNDQYQMSIYDLFGRKVFEKQLETKNQKPGTTIDVSGFSKGVYFIQVGEGNAFYRTKFVKM